MKKINVVLSIMLFAFILPACKKSSTKPPSNYPYQVKMTDAPGPYNAVNIDLRGVEITGNDNKTVMLNVHPGIYNLINFSNGIDTLIASGNLAVADVAQIRLILGPNNSVVINNVSYSLSTPSADQTGLKLQVHQTLQAGVLYSVLLDFDANKSIVDLGNGTYKLKPVIRTVEAAISGSVSGKISPAGILSYVTAVGSTTYSTNVTAKGDFLLAGLPSGIYSIIVTPALPLSPVTVTKVTVTTGVTTNIGTINL